MTRESRQRHRSRVRVRSSRRLHAFLLTLGCAGLTIGIVLLVAFLPRGNERLTTLGLVYVLGSIALLAGERAMQATQSYRKRRLAEGQKPTVSEWKPAPR